VLRTLMITGVLAVTLAGCSRPADTPPAAETPAPSASAPAAVNPALSPELAARLVRAHSPVIGPAQAPVTIVEFLDPACEACRAFAPVVKQLLFLYPEDVRVVVRYADFHPGSEDAIRLLEASRKQGKFDALLAALLDRQEEWASHASPDSERAWKIAGEIGVDLARARKEAGAAAVDKVLRLEAEDLKAIKVEQTPTFFVNGKPLPTFGVEPLLKLVASEVRSRTNP
jgi:protein-disulfide isomerase